MFRQTRFPAGHTIFQAGDAGNHAYLIEEGLIRVSLSNAAGRELNVHIARAGDLVGEIAILDGGPRTADVVALTDVLAFSMQVTDFENLLNRHPSLSKAVIALLCHRIRNTIDKLENVALHRIEVRLGRFLLNAINAEDFAKAGPYELKLGYSQSELARLLGTTRSKLNVTLRALEAGGVIKWSAKAIVCDRDALLDMLKENGI
jgi:CRP-like cAMP-binding protein